MFRGPSEPGLGDLMERFRSVDDVTADDALIEALQRDGAAVMDGWWERYSGPIAAVLARRTDGSSVPETDVHEPLEELRARRAELRAGVDPSPLILSLTVAAAGGDVTVSPDDQWIWMVRSCLDSLPPPRRAIARRRWLDGADAQQIADDLGRDPIEINDELGRVGRRLDSQLGLPGSVLSELLIDPATWADVADAPIATPAEASAAMLAGTPAATSAATLGGERHTAEAADVVTPADPSVAEVEATTDVVDRGDRSSSPGRLGRFGLLLGGAGLAVIVLFVLLVALSAGDELERTEVVSVDLIPTGQVEGADGTLTISTSDVGVTYELDVSALPSRPDDGSIYRVILVVDDGTVESIASFLGGGSFEAVSATPLGSVDQLRVVEADRTETPSGLADAVVVLRVDVGDAVMAAG